MTVDELPEPVRSRIRATLSGADEKVRRAEAHVTAAPPRAFRLRYENNTGGDFLTEYERAQCICFVSRYRHLPRFPGLSLKQCHGDYQLANLGSLRRLLNEYRSIVFNRRDSIYYGRVHSFCRAKLNNTCASKGLIVRVLQENSHDITDQFVRVLDDRRRAIRLIVEGADFAYVYNGILQHSDHTHTDRYLREYQSGKLNHIFIEHAALLDYVRTCLWWHYKLLSVLIPPELGPL